jgi:hypothetical protein
MPLRRWADPDDAIGVPTRIALAAADLPSAQAAE